MTLSDPMRTIALRLGFLGLVPFAGLAAAVLGGGDDIRAVANPALLAYGATILSFLGGIHWGLALAHPALSTRDVVMLLGIGVLPQLAGWVALLLPAPFGHSLCAAGLLALLAADDKAMRAGFAPAWFLQLRLPLTCGAALAMVAGAFST
jgi:hypothetical protein